MTAARTPLRSLTDHEREMLESLRNVAAQSPVVLDKLLRELIVARAVVATVRSQARCLPAHARRALDELPHQRPAFREYCRD